MKPGGIWVSIHEEFSDSTRQRWRDVRVGDGLTYSDGSLFIVDARAIDDGQQVTFLLRCIVPPEFGNFFFGESSVYSRPNNQLVPDDIAIVKPTSW